MHTIPQLLSLFNDGQAVRFVLASPAQQTQYRQFVSQLVKQGQSYQVALDVTETAVLIYPPRVNVEHSRVGRDYPDELPRFAWPAKPPRKGWDP